MNSRMSVLVSAILCLTLTACTSAAPPKAPKPKTVTVTDRDSGKKVELRIGGKLAVRLKANATTGYSWRGGTPTSGALKLLSSRYVSDKSPEGYTGVGGTYMADYIAAKPGKATVTFYYGRPWEGKAPDKTVTFTVTVTKPKPSPKKPRSGR